ncbi:MAG: hypothetical protein ACRCYY_10035 [Trueperaceae bacterium]
MQDTLFVYGEKTGLLRGFGSAWLYKESHTSYAAARNDNSLVIASLNLCRICR